MSAVRTRKIGQFWIKWIRRRFNLKKPAKSTSVLTRTATSETCSRWQRSQASAPDTTTQTSLRSLNRSHLGEQIPTTIAMAPKTNWIAPSIKRLNSYSLRSWTSTPKSTSDNQTIKSRSLSLWRRVNRLAPAPTQQALLEKMWLRRATVRESSQRVRVCPFTSRPAPVRISPSTLTRWTGTDLHLSENNFKSKCSRFIITILMRKF